jgi:hypothetical protein
MKTATGLVLIALGAVLAFAVNGHPGFLNVQVVGWIIMIVGLIGLVVPRSGYGWLRRRVVVRRGPDGRPVRPARRRRYPQYTMIDPAAPDVAYVAPEAAYETAEMPVVPPEPVVPPTEAIPEPVVSTDALGPDEEEEVVEEYYPE